LDRIARERSAWASQESALLEKHESAVASLTDAHGRAQAALKRDLETAQQHFDALNRQFQDTEVQLGRFRKLLQSQRASGKRLESEVAELRQTLTETQGAAQARLEAEKAQMADTFEDTIAKLRGQCERHLESIQKLSANLADRDCRLEQSRANTALLTREKQRLESTLRLHTEQTERQRHLAETTARSKLLALDADYHERLEQLRAAFDAEKRALFALLAEAFSSFFNLSEPIDERSLKRGIDRTKTELNRLASADQEIRTLVGAVEGQTTQDGVAQLLLGCRA
jgi:chromosome segregation ATPase